MIMASVNQEFYCGECDGYFFAKLNMEINQGINLSCPNCGHKHHRYIKKGQIFESGRNSNKATEEICPMKSTYHKKPVTKKMQDAANKDRWSGRRDGVPMEHGDADAARAILRQSWLEKHGGRTQ